VSSVGAVILPNGVLGFGIVVRFGVVTQFPVVVGLEVRFRVVVGVEGLRQHLGSESEDQFD
jgi:phosphohistidine swiveling domain-containing protein